MKTILEEKEVKKKELGIQEWTEEDEDEMGNIVDPYYELQEKFLGMRKLKREVVS